jgi:hypothetical protein
MKCRFLLGFSVVFARMPSQVSEAQNVHLSIVSSNLKLSRAIRTARP